MEKENTKRDLANYMIRKFKDEYESMFGIRPRVIVNENIGPKPMVVTMSTLETLCSKHLIESNADWPCPEGIRTKGRHAKLALYRQMFYKLAADFGYGPSEVGHYLGFHHATALYGRRHIEELLDVKDPDVTKTYCLLMYELKERHGAARDVQSDDESSTDTQPVLSAL